MRNYEELKRRDERDVRNMAIANASPLHHCVGTPQCPSLNPCAMCMNSARLAVQHYRPILEKRFVSDVGGLFNILTGFVPPCSD